MVVVVEPGYLVPPTCKSYTLWTAGVSLRAIFIISSPVAFPSPSISICRRNDSF